MSTPVTNEQLLRLCRNKMQDFLAEASAREDHQRVQRCNDCIDKINEINTDPDLDELDMNNVLRDICNPEKGTDIFLEDLSSYLRGHSAEAVAAKDDALSKTVDEANLPPAPPSRHLHRSGTVDAGPGDDEPDDETKNAPGY